MHMYVYQASFIWTVIDFYLFQLMYFLAYECITTLSIVMLRAWVEGLYSGNQGRNFFLDILVHTEKNTDIVLPNLISHPTTKFFPHHFLKCCKYKRLITISVIGYTLLNAERSFDIL